MRKAGKAQTVKVLAGLIVGSNERPRQRSGMIRKALQKDLWPGRVLCQEWKQPKKSPGNDGGIPAEGWTEIRASLNDQEGNRLPSRDPLRVEQTKDSGMPPFVDPGAERGQLQFPEAAILTRR